MAKRQTGRKRMGVLLALTFTAVSGMLLYDAAKESAIPTVETVTLKAQTITETVICAGTITASEGIKVYAPVPCVAGEIAVEVGDRVEKGDVLLTVDRTATLAMAVGAGLPKEQSVMASAALPVSVTAPEAGVVSAVGAASGAVLSTEAPCVVLSEGDGVVVSIALKERVLPRMAVGQAVTVSGVAFDKKEYKGVLTDIAASARSRVSGASSETVVDAVVCFAPDEVDDSLLVGLSAKAAVTVDSRENMLLIPYECLAQEENGDTYVYCLRDGIACKTAVTVKEELTQGVAVSGGVADGDVLVIAPEVLEGERLTVHTEGA